MNLTGDEIAGVVDLFGGLTKSELRTACDELAFKNGTEIDPTSFEGLIDEALASYTIVHVENDGDEIFVAGPSAFPVLPEKAEDLPHIMTIPDRSIDWATVALTVKNRLEEEAKSATDAEVDVIIDICYDLEVWGPVETADIRASLGE